MRDSLEPMERMFGRLTTAVASYSRALLAIPSSANTTITTSGGGSGDGIVKPMENARGNAFDKGLLSDIATRTTAFKFGNNKLGVMGEAGPEAVMPLKRGRDGKLGVAGGGSSITVNVEGSIITEEELLDAIEIGLERRGSLTHG